MLIPSLYPDPPYNFPALLALHPHMPYPAIEFVRDGALWRVMQGSDWRALVRVRDMGTIDKPCLDVDLLAHSGEVDQLHLHAQLMNVLATADAEREPFFEAARADSVLWPIVQPIYGMPLTRTASVYEALVNVIIEQQIAWKAARKARQWLVEWAGNRIEHEGEEFYAFPTPEQIAGATIDDLRPLKITFRRMQLLIDLSRQVIEGALDLEALRLLPPDQAYDALMTLKGIGRWTASVILSRAVGYHAYVTDNDVALQAAVNWYFNGKEGRMPAAEMVAALSRYEGHAGLAAQYTLHRWVLDRY